MDSMLRIKEEIDKIFKFNPDLPNHRNRYSWVTGFLGNPHFRIIFLAENPSLKGIRQAEKEAKKEGYQLDKESQWNSTKGDTIFRQELFDNGFKQGTPTSKGGWNCYITNIIKQAYEPKDWKDLGFEKQCEIAYKFAPVLQMEIEMIDPFIIVVMGTDRLRKLFDKAAKEGVIKYPAHTNICYIWHYAYFNRGGLNEKNLTQYREDFHRINALLQSKLHG